MTHGDSRSGINSLQPVPKGEKIFPQTRGQRNELIVWWQKNFILSLGAPKRCRKRQRRGRDRKKRETYARKKTILFFVCELRGDAEFTLGAEEKEDQKSVVGKDLIGEDEGKITTEQLGDRKNKTLDAIFPVLVPEKRPRHRLGPAKQNRNVSPFVSRLFSTGEDGRREGFGVFSSENGCPSCRSDNVGKVLSFITLAPRPSPSPPKEVLHSHSPRLLADG